MVRVTIERWDAGLNKVALNHLLRRDAKLGLAAAKEAVDRLIGGDPITFLTTDPEAAKAFCTSARSVGAICDFAVEESKPTLV